MAQTGRKGLERVKSGEPSKQDLTTTQASFMLGLMDEVDVSLTEEKCDFCSSPHPEWLYPAHTFQLSHFGSLGSWLACQVCHTLIEGGSEDLLALRAASKLARESRMDYGIALQTIHRLHKRFFQHRAGPPRRIREG